jgi:hypothetical protein
MEVVPVKLYRIESGDLLRALGFVPFGHPREKHRAVQQSDEKERV